VAAEAVTGSIVLVPGDLQLSELEDDLSQQWPKCLDSDERAFRVTTSLYRVVADAGERLLKPADGAIGGHQGAVRQAYTDFRVLAERIVTAMGGLS
jgi:hypothetical protein